MLLSGTTNPKEYLASGMAGIIEQNCAFIFSLLDDLLVVASDSIDGENVRPEKFDLIALVQEAVESLTLLAKEKKQKIKIIKTTRGSDKKSATIL